MQTYCWDKQSHTLPMLQAVCAHQHCIMVFLYGLAS
jgi:hypothetical protein